MERDSSFRQELQKLNQAHADALRIVNQKYRTDLAEMQRTIDDKERANIREK